MSKETNSAIPSNSFNVANELKRNHDLSEEVAMYLVSKYPKIIETASRLGSYAYFPANCIVAREEDHKGDDPSLDQFPQMDVAKS